MPSSRSSRLVGQKRVRETDAIVPSPVDAGENLLGDLDRMHRGLLRDHRLVEQRRNIRVSTTPGFRVKARIPVSSASAMIDRVSESSPDLLAA